jgi:K+/H+ antiporter YhaU regulatory subunit KhtT
MRGYIIAMSQKQRQRYHLLKMVIGGKITLKETSKLIGVSYRHTKIDKNSLFVGRSIGKLSLCVKHKMPA